MANPPNARINGENVTQLDNLNVKGSLYVQGIVTGSQTHVAASRTSDQAIGTTEVELSFENTSAQRGINVNGTDVTITETGVYLVSVELSLEKTASGGINAAFGWVRVNGVDANNSGYAAALTNQSPYFNATFLSSIGEVSAGDVITFPVSCTDNSAVVLRTFTIPGGPNIPAARISIVKVDGEEFNT